MLDKSVLGKIFAPNAHNFSPPRAANDDGHKLVFFTAEQTRQLDALTAPYIRQGLITNINQGKGFESGYYNVCSEWTHGYRTFICATVKDVKDGPREYGVNVGDMKINVETINFQEALTTVRRGLRELFSELPAPQARLSLV